MQTPDLPFQIAHVPVNTWITAVTVYPNQARVTRRGQLEVVKKQSMVIEIKDLPAVLHPTSVQIYPSGTAKIILQNPWIETSVKSPEPENNQEHLTTQLHQLEETIRVFKERLTVLNLQRTFLESLSEQSAISFAQGLSQHSTKLEDVTSLLQFLEKSYQEVAKEIANHERLKHDLDHQLQQRRQQIQQSLSQASSPRYQILLPLNVQEPGNLELDIVYDVDQAQWNPIYDVRLDDSLHNVQIDCMAQVQQNTGESWKKVELKLSTEIPEKGPTPPQKDIWYVKPSPENRFPERPNTNSPQIRTRSPILDETYRMLGALPGSEIPPENADNKVPSLSMMNCENAIVCFSAAEPAVILSNDCPHRIHVKQLSLESQFTYVALPQQCSAPYLQVHLVNTLENWPLLPGVAHLFRSGNYVGQEIVEYIPSGHPFQLSLGVNSEIPIQRELVNKETQSGHQCRTIWSYRLTLYNPFTYPIDMVVLEQVPVSRTDDIHISLIKSEPAVSASATGFCEWSIRLQAQTNQHIHYQYAIEHPSNIRVLGLDM